MNKFRGVLVLFFYILTFATNAQDFKIGLEGGITNDLYTYSDPADHIADYPNIDFAWGIKIEQEIMDHLGIETGIMTKEYLEGFRFNNIEPDYAITGSSNAMRTFQIPVVLCYKTKIWKDKLRFMGRTGLRYNINDSYNSMGSSEGIVYDRDVTISMSSKTNPGFEKNFWLLETGAGLSYTIFDRFDLLLYTSYFTGFQRIIQQDIEYRINGDEYEGQGFSKGDYWMIGISLKYNFGNIWNEK